MEDKKFTIYNESDVYLGGSINNGCLSLLSEVNGDYTSEMSYGLTKENTDKLFSIISFDDFVDLCKKESLIGFLEFLDKHSIEYQSRLIF